MIQTKKVKLITDKGLIIPLKVSQNSRTNNIPKKKSKSQKTKTQNMKYNQKSKLSIITNYTTLNP